MIQKPSAGGIRSVLDSYPIENSIPINDLIQIW
jgi:hypothetical protein